MATARFDPRDNGKKSAITVLYAISVLIVVLGLAFAAYSVVFHVNYAVFGMEIPGYVFAAFVVFLGIRYTRSVTRMSKSLSGVRKFNWGNFKSGSKTKKVEG